MADLDKSAADKEEKNFHTDIPARDFGFFLKGSGNLDWGMKDRLARIFNPKSGNTLMLAIDHGYFQGPTTGLERIDVNIVPLMPLADALMLTRGVLRSMVPPTLVKPIVMRCSGGPSILKELSDEFIACDIEDAIRMNVSMQTLQVFVGGEHESRSIKHLNEMVNVGVRYGMPTMAVTAVGRELTRDAKYLRLACRICAEQGANVVKTYYCNEGFETVTSSCPVPIVMAGGKKLPELDALQMAYNAIQAGAAGVDMGRNIFQSDAPVAMMTAVRQLVHEGLKPNEAFDVYETVKRKNVQPEPAVV